MADHTPKKQRGSGGRLDVELAFAKGFSNLHSIIDGRPERLIGSVTVVRRNHGDWLAMAKVTDTDTMTKMIAFGAGRTFYDALAGLNASVSAGKWKIDKPFSPQGK